MWNILSLCTGILIGGELLPRNPTIQASTPEEFNFGTTLFFMLIALQVEHLLDVIRDPAERQVTVECLVVISKLNERNPEIKLRNERLDVLKIIRDAVSRFWSAFIDQNDVAALVKGEVAGMDLNFAKNERTARRLFFDLHKDGENGTMFHLAQSCVKMAFDVIMKD